MMQRTYLDWNATAPLRPEAQAAMLAAMDCRGNPSSVHAEGRAAKAIIERARIQVASLIGCAPHDIIFTSGATEAARLWFADQTGLSAAGIEHDAVYAAVSGARDAIILPVDATGQVQAAPGAPLSALQAANSETGVIQRQLGRRHIGMSDVTQLVGKAAFDFTTCWADAVILSAHKFGGPKGAGALVLNQGVALYATPAGGGQELGRRPGTENVIGIAGFGATAAAAGRDLANGVWDEVAERRDQFEAELRDQAPDAMIIGAASPRLPNTTCLALAGWKGETQVMQMDLAGFAVSAGSACSSGKVRISRVLRAMGHDDTTAASAIRISIGPATKTADLRNFADAWLNLYRRFRAKAA